MNRNGLPLSINCVPDAVINPELELGGCELGFGCPKIVGVGLPPCADEGVPDIFPPPPPAPAEGAAAEGAAEGEVLELQGVSEGS